MGTETKPPRQETLANLERDLVNRIWMHYLSCHALSGWPSYQEWNFRKDGPQQKVHALLKTLEE